MNFQIARALSSFIRKIWPLILVAGLSACRTAPPLPQVNFAEPGWQIHQGQAVWQPNRRAPEIAGELLVATRNNGDAFVQFTKNPFPFVVARTTTNSWQIEFTAVNKTYSGHGQPPARLIWFQLGRYVKGELLAANYRAKKIDAQRWRIENKSSGEALEGYFSP